MRPPIFLGIDLVRRYFHFWIVSAVVTSAVAFAFVEVRKGDLEKQYEDHLFTVSSTLLRGANSPIFASLRLKVINFSAAGSVLEPLLPQDIRGLGILEFKKSVLFRHRKAATEELLEVASKNPCDGKWFDNGKMDLGVCFPLNWQAQESRYQIVAFLEKNPLFLLQNGTPVLRGTSSIFLKNWHYFLCVFMALGLILIGPVKLIQDSKERKSQMKLLHDQATDIEKEEELILALTGDVIGSRGKAVLSRLLLDVLSLRKSKNVQTLPELKTVELADSLKRFLAAFNLKNTCPSADYAEIFTLDPSLSLSTDEVYLWKILNNLLANGFSHMDRHEPLVVKVKEEPDHVVLKVINGVEGSDRATKMRASFSNRLGLVIISETAEKIGASFYFSVVNNQFSAILTLPKESH